MRHLSSLSGVITSNNQVPIITCFHLALEGNMLTVKATDLETTLVSRIELENARVEGVDTVAIPAKLLLDILKNMDDCPLDIAVDAKTYGIEIRAGEGVYRLAGQNPDTYPAMPEKNETVTTVMPSSALVNAINKTSFAASTDEMRQQMSGIFCEINTESITFVATDAHKLVRYRRKDIHGDDNASFILPRKPISLLKNILSNRKEESEVTIEYNSVNAFFSIDNFLFVDRMSMLNCLRRVSLFANQSTHQVRLSLNEKELTISAEDLEFANDAKESLHCEYEGEPMDIGFNAKFLTEMISNLDTEQILMEMSEPQRAGIIFPKNTEEEESAEDILMLVMPVMLAN